MTEQLGKWASRNALKRADTSTSVGQRMTEYRTRKEKVNAFGDDAAAQAAAREANRIASPAVQRVQKIGNTVLTPELVAAREARDKSLADAKNAQTVMSQAEKIDPESHKAIMAWWMAKTPEFYPSPFNLESLSNGLSEHWLLTGKPITPDILQGVYEYLKENNHLERRNARRGEAAARMYPFPTRADVTVRVPTTTQQRPKYTSSSEQRAELKKLPLDVLARQARANYKKG
jgi:hypothetical protein